MDYICNKRINFAGRSYTPGEIIHGKEILPERAEKLVKYNYIVPLEDINPEIGEKVGLTEEEVEKKITEAVAETEAKYRETIEQIRQESEKLASQGQEVNGPIAIPAGKNEDGSTNGVFLGGLELQQIFTILQMNAEDAAKAIANVEEKDSLAVLLVSDSRKTIKDAVKKQLDNLSSNDTETNAAGNVTE